MILSTLPEKLRPVRRDIFEFPHICEPALRNAKMKEDGRPHTLSQQARNERYLAIFHGLQKGFTCHALALRWQVKRRATVYEQWEQALVLIREALIKELNEDAFDEGTIIEVDKRWKRSMSMGVIKKVSGRWIMVQNKTLIRAILRIEGNDPADEE